MTLTELASALESKGLYADEAISIARICYRVEPNRDEVDVGHKLWLEYLYLQNEMSRLARVANIVNDVLKEHFPEILAPAPVAEPE